MDGQTLVLNRSIQIFFIFNQGIMNKPPPVAAIKKEKSTGKRYQSTNNTALAHAVKITLPLFFLPEDKCTCRRCTTRQL